MDKQNTFIGIGLIAAALLLGIFGANQTPPPAEPRPAEPSRTETATEDTPTTTTATDAAEAPDGDKIGRAHV